MEADEETLSLPEGSTALQLLEQLEEKKPALKAFQRRFRVAQNQTFVELDTRLEQGAEVALIPPVSGGAGDVGSVKISYEPLDANAALEAVRRRDCGAVVLFLGTVRDITGELVTERLDYTAYEAMAESELKKLCREAVEMFELKAVVVEHRVGSLDPGEIAVVVAASSAHRDGAFQGARYLIDQTKERVPLWKKEIGPDGQVWLEGDTRIPTA